MKANGAAAQVPLPARKIELCFQNLKEIESLLALPKGVPDRIDRICAFAYAISAHAPHRGIAELARKVRREARSLNARLLSNHVSRMKAELEAVRKTLIGDAVAVARNAD